MATRYKLATQDRAETFTNKTLTSPTLVTPILGTPTSGTLTNCTFPTLNQNTTGTAAGLSATLAIASGGTGATTLAGASIPTYTSTNTLTNKRITPRVTTEASSATPTINTDNSDIHGLTAQAVDITSFTTNLTGTPTNGQKLLIYIVGTATRAITWGASFESGAMNLPVTTKGTTRLNVSFIYNSVAAKWNCMAVGGSNLIGTVASAATPAINTDNNDAYSITAQAEAITSFTTNLTGTPTNFQKLLIRIKDNGTARAITWGASFVDKGVALPTTTVISKCLTVGFFYDSVAAVWGCVAVGNET